MGTKGWQYAIRDGFAGMRKNPLVLLASITTMFLMLLLVSAFVLFTQNVRHLIHVAAEQPPIEVMFRVDSNPGNVFSLEQQLAANENVVYHQVLTPQENFESFKQRIGKQELFEGFEFAEHIPYSIQIRLKDPALGPIFKDEVSGYPGVREVLMESHVMALLQRAVRWVAWISAGIFAVLLVITVFIISNMIRVAALSRAAEISIMKYVGATNRYIRIPFVIEGLLVGLISAVLAAAMSAFAYHLATVRLGTRLASEMQFALLPASSLLWLDLPLLILFGLVLGGLTTGLSVRRYVQV